jgi:hypothetical protein
MSRRRLLAERLLGSGLEGISPRRRDWLRAALAELPAVPDRQRLRWSLGIAGIALADLAEQSFLPWRREQGARPPAGFAAALSLALLALPFALVTAAGVSSHRLPALAAALVTTLGIALALWLNLAALLRAQPLGGLIYAVSLRVLPLNLAVFASAIALGVAALRVGII